MRNLLFLALIVLFSITSCDKNEVVEYYCNGHQDTIYVFQTDTVIVSHTDTVIINNTDEFFFRIYVDYTPKTYGNNYYTWTSMTQLLYVNEFNEIRNLMEMGDFNEVDNMQRPYLSVGPVLVGFTETVTCYEETFHLTVDGARSDNDTHIVEDRSNIQIMMSKNRGPFEIVKEGKGQVEYTVE